MKSTRVRVYYGNPDLASDVQPSADFIRGHSSSGGKIKKVTRAEENGKRYIEAELSPGLYCYKVHYPAERDFGIKYFYLDGSDAYLEYTMMLEPLVDGAFMERAFSGTTDQVLNRFYSTDDIKGFKTYDTPAMRYHANDRRFTSIDELCDFCEDIAEKHSFAHVFYPIPPTEQYGLRTPVMVFTKDNVPKRATGSELAAVIKGKGIREIMLITGGMHGNEPAGWEAVLAYASELCGEYGKEVLDAFGAVVLMPAVSADNMCSFKREYPDGCNSNRDLLRCEHEGSRAQVAVYNMFKPTVVINCHEDVGVLGLNDADLSVNDIHNVAVAFNGQGNCPTYDVKGIIDGTVHIKDHEGMQMTDKVIDAMNDMGYRAHHYQIPNYFPASEKGYAAIRGSYAFLLEMGGINSGKFNFPLRVHGHVSAIKLIAEQVMARHGAIAAKVCAARAAASVKHFDESNRFILGLDAEIGGEDLSPSIYVDGTFKDEYATKKWQIACIPTRTRAMPTAYVIPADVSNVSKILELLEIHGIEYKKLEKGTTLSLRRYVITPSEAYDLPEVSLADAEDITFDDGAYAVSTDSEDAYLIAYLFEPDSYPSKKGLRISLYNMGLIGEQDSIYRCELDNVIR